MSFRIILWWNKRAVVGKKRLLKTIKSKNKRTPQSICLFRSYSWRQRSNAEIEFCLCFLFTQLVTLFNLLVSSSVNGDDAQSVSSFPLESIFISAIERNNFKRWKKPRKIILLTLILYHVHSLTVENYFILLSMNSVNKD